MVEQVKSLIKEMGLFSTVNFFGGMEQFKKMVIKNPELEPFLGMFRASCGVSSRSNDYPEAFFEFDILDFDVQDENFGELMVNMEVDFDNLSGEEIYNLKQWMGAVADDFGFEIYDLDDYFPPHVNLYIKSFNGRPYEWPGYDDVISDEEAFELLDKTDMWDGMIRESVEEEDEKDYGNDTLNIGKKRLFRLWDNQGYANFDETLMKLFEIERRYEDIVNEWVVMWNKKHNISPTKYFEDDGYKFHTLNKEHLYYSDDSKQITVSDSEGLSGDVMIHRIDINTNDKSVNVWIEIIFDSITEPMFQGKSFDEYYDYDNMDDDDYTHMMDSYRDDFLWLTTKYIRDKYTDKMGYYLEMDFS